MVTSIMNNFLIRVETSQETIYLCTSMAWQEDCIKTIIPTLRKNK
jgi:hypothetical protein